MPPVIEEKKEELFALCRKFNVQTLELFGSAARGTFDPETSDLDFLVDIPEPEPVGHADRYFGLLFALEELFGREIDLLETGAIRNPYLLRSINEDRTVVYAA
jgi:predicted nucleotidyltransferase